MGEIDKISTGELEKRIANRINQVKRIIGFIDKLTEKAGDVIDYNQGSAHTHVVSIVRGFKDFTFLYDTGHTMFGGNDCHIWYHPDKKEIDTKKDTEVFSISYQNRIEEGSIHVFNPDPKWLNLINEMIDRQEEVIAEAKGQKKNRDKQRMRQYKDEEKRNNLLERAKNLKL